MAMALVIILSMLLMISDAMGDKAKDREECADQLVGLATCLPYVGGEAKAPTPDCCSGLKQVLKNDKKCLCVIVRDRNDPELGLNINVTLALGLPSVCHQPANVSKCPALLHMDPNSPEAQVFYQFDKSSSHGGITPAAAPTPIAGGDTMNNNSEGRSSDGTSDGCLNANRWWGLESVFGGALLLYLII